MAANNIIIIVAILALVVSLVLFTSIVIFIFYRRKKQQGESCGWDSTDFGDCFQDFLHAITLGQCGARYQQNKDPVISYQPEVPTGPNTTTELETFNEELPTKDTNNDNVTSCHQEVPTVPNKTPEWPKKDTSYDHVTSYPSQVPTGPITTEELQNFTEELLEEDTNNVAHLIRINHQGRTNSRDTDDKAPEPLLTIHSSAVTGPTITAFRALMDNYDPNVGAREWVTDAEIQEQNKFLHEMMKTKVMKHTEHFLTTRGIIKRPLRDVLNEIWFTSYSRAGRNDGSSGFEHVFIGEIKNEKVCGFHNWIQFSHEEWDGDLDYKGIMGYVDLGDKGQVIKGRFTWMNETKPVGTLFVGTSPEFEMALYTVCFLVKPDQRCQVKLNNKKFNIQTHSLSWNHKLLGGAFPDI